MLKDEEYVKLLTEVHRLLEVPGALCGKILS